MLQFCKYNKISYITLQIEIKILAFRKKNLPNLFLCVNITTFDYFMAFCKKTHD